MCVPADTTYRNGRIRYYRGVIRAVNDGSGNKRTVNVLNIESYLRGVVPRESPAGWGDLAGGLGMNALRAQAVAARSYATSETRYSYAKTCDTQTARCMAVPPHGRSADPRPPSSRTRAATAR